MAKDSRRCNYLAKSDSVMGRVVAEQDRELAEYYVDSYKYVDRAIDTNDPAVFFIGPKGIGKSAILQMVRLNCSHDKQRIVNITPDDLAFSALANIEATTPLLKDFGRNQWLFKSLWDYVLSLEILRREYRTETSIEQFLKGIFRTYHEREARRLLNLSLSDQASPQSLSSRILLLIKEVEISAEHGDSKLAGKVGLEKDGERGSHLNTLGLINSVAKHVHDNLRNTYYIIIDDLDLHWTDTPIQNEFIAALFLSLKNFSKPPHLKCVVSMKEQIFRSLPLQDRDKFHDWICQVEWDLLAVKQMIDERIEKNIGINRSLIWGTLFPTAAFERMWKHTYGRPRELIRLSGLCLTEGRRAGHAQVESQDVESAIAAFSDERIDDIASEHAHAYPALSLVLRKFKGWPKEFEFNKFVNDFVEYVALEVECKEGQSLRYTWAGGFVSDPKRFACILLEIGFLQIKANRTSQPRFFDVRNPQEITANTWLAIHPTFWAGLGAVGV
jgi:hypothetical protein